MGDSQAESLSTSATVGDDDDTSFVTEIVDTLYKVYGAHPGFRVNHAKGVVVKGSFVATPPASALSRAPLIDGSSIPVTVRFTNDGGITTISGGAPANPKGMAIKFDMPDGSEVVMVILALKGAAQPHRTAHQRSGRAHATRGGGSRGMIAGSEYPAIGMDFCKRAIDRHDLMTLTLTFSLELNHAPVGVFP
ncbi:hypothetical protein SAMN05446935_7905 [Burkholderia sp. YR290]|nr:hypothetical protein SAMN05446935_7905 [Burkholderia sp. YR290]